MNRFKRTGKREEIFLGTKFGFVVKDGAYSIDGSPVHAKLSIEKSLKHLGVDYIDLYYLHVGVESAWTSCPFHHPVFSVRMPPFPLR